MLLETRYEHISLDEYGQPTIAGTTIKVKELVAERLAWGWSAEELLINHPDLTLGKVYIYAGLLRRSPGEDRRRD
jgi:uncharacterized protein (DUF433 family)